MSEENARQFVAAMRLDAMLRRTVHHAAANGNLDDLLQSRGYSFELHHLAIAMAECMDEMAGDCAEGARTGLSAPLT